jgi:hypothetical protein
MGLSAFIKGLDRGGWVFLNILPSAMCRDAARKSLQDARISMLGYPASRTLRNKFLLFINYPVSSIL